MEPEASSNQVRAWQQLVVMMEERTNTVNDNSHRSAAKQVVMWKYLLSAPLVLLGLGVIFCDKMIDLMMRV
jgi:hypothetical protein